MITLDIEALIDRADHRRKEIRELGYPTASGRGTSMPDFVADSDDDETIEPWFNEPGEFGDNSEESDDED